MNSIGKKINRKSLAQLVATFLVFSLAIFLLFHKLSDAPIQIWDEAVYANNAVEMAIDGDVLVLKRDGKPTLYNTKPPLVIWLQAICLSIFGVNEFAVRLPSALAGLFTFLALLFFSFRVLKKPLIGIIACLVLASTSGFISSHVTRTGDLDALLTVFITLFTLSIFTFLIKKKVGIKPYIFLTGLFVTLAYFSKSVAAFLPLPGLFLCLLISRKAKDVLVNRQTYIVGFLGLLVIVAYYFIRESMLSGYWDKVFFSEFSRMHKNIMPYHSQAWNYYLVQMIWNERFFPFVFVLPFAVLLNFFQKNKTLQYLSFYCTVWSLSYFLIISIPTVKLWWYMAPLFPILSLLIAIFFSQVLSYFKSNYFKAIVATVSVILLFCFPLQKVLTQIEKDSSRVEWQEMPGQYIRELKKKRPDLKNYKVIIQVKEEEHIDAVNFYVRGYNHFEDYNISLETNPENIFVGDTLMLCWNTERNIMKSKFEFELITKDKECGLYVLTANKK